IELVSLLFEQSERRDCRLRCHIGYWARLFSGAEFRRADGCLSALCIGLGIPELFAQLADTLVHIQSLLGFEHAAIGVQLLLLSALGSKIMPMIPIGLLFRATLIAGLPRR